MSAAEIALALADKANALARELFPAGRRQGREWCIGSIAGEPGQSLRTAISGNHRGRWREYADGTGGDMLDLIAAVHFGGDVRQALSWARRWLGQEERPPKQPAGPATRPIRYETLSRFGRQLWASCRSIDSQSPAALYLGARGCALPHPDGDLRWHPALNHPSGHIGPALLAVVTDIHDPKRWLTLHRTWIRGDGSPNKADVDPPRLLLKDHRKSGGCIRLWPDDWVSMGLAIGEGIETTLTLARGFTPAWSVIDAGNLGAFPVLAGIEALTVAVDHDVAGLKAFKTVAERWHAAGREVRKVLVPKPGDDLNDWARSVDRA